MLLSIANTTPRNIETVRVNDLLPLGIQPSAKTFVDLIEHYYKYLNSEGLPSAEIGSISSLKDIDLVSMKYLEQIEELIGKSIPNSRVLNRVELYKIIVRYYNTRGSQDSIHTFFKIFFDQLVEIVYPREHLFDLSGATGSWLGDKLLQDNDLIPYVRDLSDEAAQTISGIIYSAKAADGSGQLISIEVLAEDPVAYAAVVTYDNGLITVIPGGKSHLALGGTTPVVNSVIAAYLPARMYYSGIVNGRPAYSNRLDYVTPWVGTESRMQWDGAQWDFTIGSPTGDMYAYYADENVADPIEVVTWHRGWGPIDSGSLDNVTAFPVVNGQIFEALRTNADVTLNVLLTTDVLASAWTEVSGVVPRTYLTTNDLPTNVVVGSISVMNGFVKHPYVMSIATELRGDIVWKQYMADDWTYSDHKSFASDDYKIFDGYYWQNYSYVVRSDIDASSWYDAYLKFVHPSGLKMFSAIAIEIISRNEWYNLLNYTPEDITSDDSWMQALIPPSALDSSLIGYHTPKFQPGWLRDQVLRYLFTYLIDPVYEADLARFVMLAFKFTIGATDVRNSYVSEQYQISEKFINTLQIGAGMLNKVIGDADEEYSSSNSCRLLNLSAFIGSEDNIQADFSFYDFDFGEGDVAGEWDASFIDEDAGDPSGVWDSSSYENV